MSGEMKAFADSFQQFVRDVDVTFDGHEARIKALEKVGRDCDEIFGKREGRPKYSQNQLDAAVDKALKDSLTGKLKYSQLTLDAAVAEAKADGKRFSNRPCFTPREHNMLKKAAVEVERERCVKIVLRESLAWVASPQIILAVKDACENIQNAIEAGE